MIATPTTSVAILRGQGLSPLGDVVDLPTPWKTSVPASLVERSQRVIGPNQSQDRIVRSYRLRVAHGTGLRKDDRVRDRTGRIFIVENVYQPTNPFLPQDEAADLSLTS